MLYNRGVNGSDWAGFGASLYPKPKFKPLLNPLETQWVKKLLKPNPTHGFSSLFWAGRVKLFG